MARDSDSFFVFVGLGWLMGNQLIIFVEIFLNERKTAHRRVYIFH